MPTFQIRRKYNFKIYLFKKGELITDAHFSSPTKVQILKFIYSRKEN